MSDEPKTSPKLKVGDQVRHKSGTPRGAMVRGIDGDTATCRWTIVNERGLAVMEEHFQIIDLEKVE